jgi:hypothetical protein
MVLGKANCITTWLFLAGSWLLCWAFCQMQEV